MMKNSCLMEMLFVLVCIKASVVLVSTQTTRRRMEVTPNNNINNNISNNNINNINNNNFILNSSGIASGEHCSKSTISNKSVNNSSNSSNNSNLIIRTNRKTTESTRSKTHSRSQINNHHSDNIVVASADDTNNKNAGDKAEVAATRATTSPRKRSLGDSRQDLDSFNNNNKNNDDYYGRPSVEVIDDSSDQEADYNGDVDYKMLTKGDTLYILPNTSIRLECRFKTAAWYNFNFWDNPIVWYKTQHGQETRINMMGNIDHPFNKDRRMNVDYLVYNNYRSFSSHRFLLILPDVRPQDSGQYTCRVYAPENVQLMNVTHHLFVETPPEIILLTNESPNSFDMANQSRERLVQMLNQNLEFDHSSPSVIGCFVLGKSNCPRIKLSFGDHEVLSNLTFSQSVIKVDGEKGMLLFTYATWAVLENYQPMKGHDGAHVTCSVHSRDGPYTSVSAILHIRYRPEVNCSTTSPYLSIVTSPNDSSSSSPSLSASSGNSYELRVTCTIKSHPPLTSLMWKINDVMTLAGNDAIGHVASRLKESSDGRSLVAWIHLGDEEKLPVNRIVLQAVNRIGTTRIVLTNNRPTMVSPTSPHSTPSLTSSPTSSSSSTTKRLLPPPASSSSSSFSSLKSSFIPGQMKRTIKRKPLRFTGCATCAVVFSRSCFPVVALVVLVVWRFPS